VSELRFSGDEVRAVIDGWEETSEEGELVRSFLVCRYAVTGSFLPIPRLLIISEHRGKVYYDADGFRHSFSERVYRLGAKRIKEDADRLRARDGGGGDDDLHQS
jgi:hypothetical protein